MHLYIRVAACVLPILAAALGASPVRAQSPYPNRPVRLIVPFPPGGGVTAVARVLSPGLGESLGQNIVVDNRPGGNTIIGTEAMVRAVPDGYTLLLVSSAHVINPFLLPNLPYDTNKDFAPVACATSGGYLMVAHPSLPANTLQEFIALAKAKPGQLNYSTSGSGGVQHLAGELFNLMAGVKTQHIPYKGAGPAVIELLGGQVQFSFQPPGNALPHIKAGKLKAIAVPGDHRIAALPQVPTFAEAGMPGFEVRSWIGMLAPAATPKPIINRLSTELGKILKMPETRDKLALQQHEPFFKPPEQFGEFIKAEMGRVGKVVKAANIKLDH
jgi:tripartite-type tricarboxylate transporter receptor subunit TctC